MAVGDGVPTATGNSATWPQAAGPAGTGAAHHTGREELGTARWTTPDELRSRFTFDGSLFALNDVNLWEGRSNGQIWLGETVDATADPIGYADDRHVCLISGSRGGKGTSVIIPNLCYWPGSCMVIDPKGENAVNTG